MLEKNTQKIKIDYDKNSDVLYITFGRSQKSIADGGDFLSGIVIMKNPLTHKITGVTLDAFTKRVKRGYLNSIVKKMPPSIDKAFLMSIYNQIEGTSLQHK